MGINKVILVGHVGRDPELRSLPSGTHIATFSLATTERGFKDENGNPRTEWHNIVAWGKLAEVCQRYVTKGKQLYIEGSIRTRSYEQDGQKKYRTEVHIQNMEMLGSPPRGGSGGGTRDDYGEVSQGFPDEGDDIPF